VPFEPLGYTFEVASPFPPENVKSSIRAGKKGWLDPKDGPRGWIIGPLMCLWMSAFDRYGPMIIAVVKKDGSGTRVVGRAGADLNGTAFFLLLAPLMALITWKMHQAGQGSTRSYVVIGAIFGLGLPLTLWLNSQDRKHAEPLVRFIRNTITPSARSRRTNLGSVTIDPIVRLSESGRERIGPVTAQDVYDTLQNAGVGDFVIISTAAETYLQTLLQNDGFVIERRDGDRMHHFKAVRRSGDIKVRDLFSFEETLAAMIAYGSGSVLPATIGWEPLELPE